MNRRSNATRNNVAIFYGVAPRRYVEKFNMMNVKLVITLDVTKVVVAIGRWFVKTAFTLVAVWFVVAPVL